MAASDSDSRPTALGRKRRRLPWAPGGVQFKVFASTFALTVIVLGFGLVASLRGILDARSNGSMLPPAVLETISTEYYRQLGVSLLAAVLLSLTAAIAYFGIAGPIYRFRRYFEGLVNGPWDRRVRLRDTDSLQDLAGSINQGLDALRDVVRRQRETLADVGNAVEAAAPFDDARWQAICARIAALDAEVEPRLPALAECGAECGAEVESREPVSASA